MSFQTSHLSGDNVLRDIHDPVTQTIRVNAAFSGSGGEVIISHTDDSIRLGDGTGFLTSTVNGGKRSLDVSIQGGVDILSLPSGLATDTLQIAGNASLVSIDTKLNTLTNGTQKTILTNGTDNVEIINTTPIGSEYGLVVRTIPSGIQVVDIGDLNGISTSTLQTDGNASLVSIDNEVQSINSKLPSIGQQNQASSLSVVLASDQEPFYLTGTIDGESTGTKYGFVNNLRQQVLSAHDVTPSLTYADFGTKNQRITKIEYTSPTFPGTTVKRDINYVLDGTKYRKTTMPWSIV